MPVVAVALPALVADMLAVLAVFAGLALGAFAALTFLGPRVPDTRPGRRRP